MHFSFEAPVTNLVFGGGGFIFALGDGAFHIVGEAETRSEGHRGVSLCLTAHEEGALSGGDDGRLLLVRGSGDVREIASFGKSWINAVARTQASGLIAAAAGKTVHVLDSSFTNVAAFQSATTVAGLDFDPKGKRVVASHYNGVSVWMAANKDATRKGFDWKGSHLAVLWSPCGRFIVTAMQEAAIHGWRVEDGGDFRMDGYPARVRAIAFADRGRKLATTGAGPEVLLWPFVGPKGPMGRQADVLSSTDESAAVALAARPKGGEIAVGYDDGSIRLFATETGEGYTLEPAAGGEVAGLSWSTDGVVLGYGRADGTAGMLKVAF